MVWGLYRGNPLDVPDWVYWCAAVLAMIAAFVASVLFVPEVTEAHRSVLLRKIWAVPIFLSICATVVTMLRRRI